MLSVLNRIYADYLMPSRMREYENLLTQALQAGYSHLTIPEFYKLILENKLTTVDKYFIHRHDIDTDVKTAERFFKIEKSLGIKTSYYFRLNTWDVDLIRTIHHFGSEAGYHYEELAQYCKDHNLKSNAVVDHFDNIRKLFKSNLHVLEAKAGFKIKSIASHGDFVNRITGLANHRFVTPELMTECGVELECYNPVLLQHYTTILSDTMHPVYYKPQNPFDCIKRGDSMIYLLTHPRHWHVARIENTTDNIKRLIEGIKYKG